jgi:hypothetical protein
MNSKAAMEALMSIEGFRSLNQVGSQLSGNQAPASSRRYRAARAKIANHLAEIVESGRVR